jgi:hypothetical protein
MKIVIETDVFANNANTMALDNVGYWALRGRHRIVVQDETAAPFLSWLGHLDKDLRADWRAIMEDGYLREALEPATRTIHITSEVLSKWNENPPRLNIPDSIQFISSPLRILLEDAVSDRHFILKMSTNEQRHFLVSREADQDFIFEHGGGITSMIRRITAIANEGPRGRLSTWAMFDSDALQPTRPSSQADALTDRCVQAQIPYHRLTRRSIENYLPKNAIKTWAYIRRRDREARFLALLELSDDQRYHFNFKHGFAGDQDRPAPGAGSLHRGLAPKVVAALHHGFGAGIGDLFQGESVTERDLQRDSGWSEMNPVITQLIALLR